MTSILVHKIIFFPDEYKSCYIHHYHSTIYYIYILDTHTMRQVLLSFVSNVMAITLCCLYFSSSSSTDTSYTGGGITTVTATPVLRNKNELTTKVYFGGRWWYNEDDFSMEVRVLYCFLLIAAAVRNDENVDDVDDDDVLVCDWDSDCDCEWDCCCLLCL